MSTNVEPQKSFKDKAAIGPFTWRAGALFVATGVGLYYYFDQEKAKVKEKKRQETATTSIGRPNIGGPFSLTTHHDPPRTFTERDLIGKFSLIYFGFTNCPDICPEELDKMGAVVDETDKLTGKQLIQPLFISCDPARDTIEQVRSYMQDFHPRMTGLTGSYENVKQACKSYRVYFSTPPDAKPTEDYLVDHSIFFYLMDPNGQFVDAFGKNSTAEDVTRKVMESVQRWEATK